VIAHQAAGDSHFIGHHVHSRDLDRAPIADDKVGAALAEQLPAELFRPQLADKVNDGMRAAVRKVAHRRDHVRAALQHMPRAQLVRQGPRRRALINGDGARATQGMQDLQRDVAQAAYAYDHTIAARVEVGGRAFGHPIGGDAGVGQGGDGDRDDMLVEFDQRPLIGEQVLGKATIRVEPRKEAPGAIHVFPPTAAGAHPAGAQGVTDDPPLRKGCPRSAITSYLQPRPTQTAQASCYPKRARRCAMESMQLWARDGEAVRQAMELGEIAHIETASEELTDEFLLFAIESGLLQTWANAFPDPRREPEIGMEVILPAH